MKYRYSKFTGDDLDDLDLEELLSKLSDLLLSSGFDSSFGMPYDDDLPGHSSDALHDAILEALLNGMLSDETVEKLDAALKSFVDGFNVIEEKGLTG